MHVLKHYIVPINRYNYFLSIKSKTFLTKVYLLTKTNNILCTLKHKRKDKFKNSHFLILLYFALSNKTSYFYLSQFNDFTNFDRAGLKFILWESVNNITRIKILRKQLSYIEKHFGSTHLRINNLTKFEAQKKYC